MLILVICDAGRTIFLPVFFFARRRKGPLIRPPSTTVDAIGRCVNAFFSYEAMAFATVDAMLPADAQ